MRRWWLVVAVVLLAFVAVGVGWYIALWRIKPQPIVSPPVTPACEPGQAADYFPYHQGTQADFAGQGNEYASFKLKVVGEGGGKVEWRRDNGGTVLAEVFQVAPNQVTRIYREGEVYDNNPRLNSTPNQSEVILQGPVQVGTQWSVGNATSQITDISATVPALGNQILSCVVVVETTTPNSPLTRNYYHQQYGWVLSIFDPTGNAIESRLSSFTP